MNNIYFIPFVPKLQAYYYTDRATIIQSKHEVAIKDLYYRENRP